ncbi:MAG: hypothetical protein EZS28_040990, partial [Streblomastix strix]
MHLNNGGLDQCVGNEVPLTLNQVQNKKQCVERDSLDPTMQHESATVRWGDNPFDPEKYFQENDQMLVRRSSPEVNVPAADEPISMSSQCGSRVPQFPDISERPNSNCFNFTN